LGLLIAKAFWDTFFIAVDKVQIGLFRALWIRLSLAPFQWLFFLLLFSPK
jgi:hypothetical protein